MSNLWSWIVIGVVVVHLVAYLWLLKATASKKVDGASENETTGHVWDDDLTEYNNPLPRWWLYLFVLTIVFSVAYLYLYPGMGNFTGSKDWTQVNQYEAEYAAVLSAREKAFAEFIDLPVTELAQHDKAMRIGERLFANNCALCHGSDAGGAVGFPNLADDDWLWGGTPEKIIESVSQGRNGVMPPFAPALGEDGVKQVVAYVKSLHGDAPDAALASQGEQKFAMFCAACHGPDAKGNPMFGAPNLTDDIWLHGSVDFIQTALYEGINGQMPAHKDILDENQIKLVSAYVYSLSHD